MTTPPPLSGLRITVFAAVAAVALALDWPARQALHAARIWLDGAAPDVLHVIDRAASVISENLNAQYVVPLLLIVWIAAELASLAGNWKRAPLSLAFWDVRPLRHKMVFMTICLLLTTAAIWIPKLVLGRARPQTATWIYDFHPFALHSGYFSMPSGHTQFVAAVSFAAAVMYPRLRIPAIGLTALMGLTRMVQGRHYLSDVTVAALICWLVVQWAARRWYYRPPA